MALVPTFGAMSDTVKAFVLDDTVTGVATEPRHFANFPGLWISGQPVAVTELGFDNDDDALTAVAELGLPLKLTKVPVGKGLMPEVPNHVRAGEVPVALDEADVVEAAPVEQPKPAEAAGKNRTAVAVEAAPDPEPEETV